MVPIRSMARWGLSPARGFQAALACTDKICGAVAEQTLLDRLRLKPGGTMRIGSQEFRVAAVLTDEPDRISGGFSLGPHVLSHEAALKRTGLVTIGSLINYHYRVALAAGETRRRVQEGRQPRAFADAGWQIRDRNDAAPGIRRFVEQVTMFLTLVGLTALAVGGVGAGQAIGALARPQARGDCDAEGAGRGRRADLPHLFPAGDGDRAGCRCRGLGRRCGAALRRRLALRRQPARARRLRHLSGPARRWRPCSGCSRRRPLPFRRWRVRAKSRRPACSATSSRPPRHRGRLPYLAAAAACAAVGDRARACSCRPRRCSRCGSWRGIAGGLAILRLAAAACVSGCRVCRARTGRACGSRSPI